MGQRRTGLFARVHIITMALISGRWRKPLVEPNPACLCGMRPLLPWVVRTLKGPLVEVFVQLGCFVPRAGQKVSVAVQRDCNI